jgi:hypothetical protein
MATQDDAIKKAAEAAKKAQEKALKAAEQAAKIKAASEKAAALISLSIEAAKTIKLIKETAQKAKSSGLKAALPPGLGGLVISIVKQIIINLNLQEKAIQKIIDELQDQCPSETKLQEIIDTKNKIKDALTKVDQAISSANQVGVTLSTILTVLDTIVLILRNLPLPTSVPPGVGIPLLVINKFRDAIDVADKFIDQGKAITDGIVGAVGGVQGIVQTIIANLDLLDQAIELCASKIALEQAETPEQAQEIISAFLDNIKSLNTTPQSSDNSNPSSTTPLEEITLPVSYRGFSINIENAPLDSVLQNIPKRRAVATQTSTNVRIEGDYSFSSSAQVLIDTMKFAIDNYLG